MNQWVEAVPAAARRLRSILSASARAGARGFGSEDIPPPHLQINSLNPLQSSCSATASPPPTLSSLLRCRVGWRRAELLASPELPGSPVTGPTRARLPARIERCRHRRRKTPGSGAVRESRAAGRTEEGLELGWRQRRNQRRSTNAELRPQHQTQEEWAFRPGEAMPSRPAPPLPEAGLAQLAPHLWLRVRWPRWLRVRWPRPRMHRNGLRHLAGLSLGQASTLTEILFMVAQSKDRGRLKTL